MSERPRYLPALPDPWPRPGDFVPRGQTKQPTTPEPVMAQAEVSSPTSSDTRTPRTAGRAEGREKQPRVTLSGRLGSAVTYGQTPKGQAKAHFVLGVHTPTE